MAYRETARTRARLAATRERIVAAAREQVAEGGYASAGVQAVARRAGVATGSVYRHFPSKAELFAEVFRRASQRELDVVAAVTADESLPPAERVAAAVEAFARRALAAPVMAYALLAEPVDPAVEAERLAFRRGYRDAFARALEDGIRAGEFRDHDTEVVAAALVGALGEALLGPLSPASNGRGARRHHDALIANLIQFCLNAIGALDREIGRGSAGENRGWQGRRAQSMLKASASPRTQPAEGSQPPNAAEIEGEGTYGTQKENADVGARSHA